MSGTMSCTTRSSVASKSSVPASIVPARWRNLKASSAETTGGGTARILWAERPADHRGGGGGALHEAEKWTEVAGGREPGQVEAGEARAERVVEHGEAAGRGDVQAGQVRHAREVGLEAAGVDDPVGAQPAAGGQRPRGAAAGRRRLRHLGARAHAERRARQSRHEPMLEREPA